MANSKSSKPKGANRDPITGEPGAHPVGAAVGAGVGALAGVASTVVAGAAAGTTVGPVGTLAGAVVGGVIGGAAGIAAGEEINPTSEDAYWRDNFESRDYIREGADYDTYGPAYRYGVDAYVKYQGREFDEIEPDLSQDWKNVRGKSPLEWSEARHASRDAFERLSNPDNIRYDNDADR